MARADAERVLRDLGRRFAEIRVERELTQEALAERLGISTKYLQRIERGRSMTLRTLIDLAARLDVPLQTLFTPPRSRVVRIGRPPRSAPGVTRKRRRE